MERCSKCGKEYSSGIYHSIHCSVILKDDRISYDWNCIRPIDTSLCSIEERIIDDFIIHSKVKSSNVYE